MHVISDLSQLLTLLSGNHNEPIELEIDASLIESLHGCITLGVQDLLRHVPGALPPRDAEPFVCKQGSIPKLMVNINDFSGLITEAEKLNETVRVTGNFVEHALGWVEVSCQAPRVEMLIAELQCQVDQGDEVIEIPIIHLQELIDWLDQIQRNDPNALADEIRADVKALNDLEMKGKINWTNYA